MTEFSEKELQEMFEDLRFFFPDEEVYKQLEIFHCIDVFEGDHYRIKDHYKNYLNKKR